MKMVMALGNARNEDSAACLHLGAALFAAIGMAILLTMAPSADVDTAPVTATHDQTVQSGHAR